MKKLRKQLIHWLFEHSQNLYTRWFKKNHTPWNLSTTELLSYPTASFGYHLGCFLQQNQFELIPKVERHDAYHTLTQYGTKVEDEIALQFLCFGNGKRSKYMFGAILLGSLILPDYYRWYYQSYQIGKKANAFHHYDYRYILEVNYHQFRSAIFNKDFITKQHNSKFFSSWKNNKENSQHG